MGDYILFFGLLIVILFISIYFLVTKVGRKIDRNKMKVEKKYKDSRMDQLVERAMRNPRIDRVASKIAYRLYSVNNKSLLGSYKVAIRILVIYGVVMLTSSLIILLVNSLWYIGAMYVLSLVAFSIGLYFLFTSWVKLKLNKSLPETFKLVSSRFGMSMNIKKSLKESLDSMGPSMKKLVGNIIEAMEMNDMEKIKKVFEEEEKYFNNTYVTLLLTMIQQAYYKGGNEVVVDRFESVTKDVQEEIGRSKEIISAVRGSLMITMVTIPLMLVVVEGVTNKIGIDQIANYYQSPTGITMKLGLILSTVVYVLVLIYMEHSNTQ